MNTSRKNILLVNVAYWIVAAALYPLSSLLTNDAGETPKIFSLLIPLAFIGLAAGSTIMFSRALEGR